MCEPQNCYIENKKVEKIASIFEDDGTISTCCCCYYSPSSYIVLDGIPKNDSNYRIIRVKNYVFTIEYKDHQLNSFCQVPEFFISEIIARENALKIELEELKKDYELVKSKLEHVDAYFENF